MKTCQYQTKHENNKFYPCGISFHNENEIYCNHHRELNYKSKELRKIGVDEYFIKYLQQFDTKLAKAKISEVIVIETSDDAESAQKLAELYCSGYGGYDCGTPFHNFDHGWSIKLESSGADDYVTESIPISPYVFYYNLNTKTICHLTEDEFNKRYAYYEK